MTEEDSLRHALSALSPETQNAVLAVLKLQSAGQSPATAICRLRDLLLQQSAYRRIAQQGLVESTDSAMRHAKLVKESFENLKRKP